MLRAQLLSAANRPSAGPYRRGEGRGSGETGGSAIAHLLVGHPHAEATEAHDRVEGGLQVCERLLQRRPQPGQVAGGEAVAGGQGLRTGQEEEAEGCRQTQPPACGETNTLPCGLPVRCRTPPPPRRPPQPAPTAPRASPGAAMMPPGPRRRFRRAPRPGPHHLGQATGETRVTAH